MDFKVKSLTGNGESLDDDERFNSQKKITILNLNEPLKTQPQSI